MRTAFGADDLLVVGLTLTVAGVMLVGAQYVSPPIFDRVGSAAVPRAVAVALFLLTIVFVIQRLMKKPAAEAGESSINRIRVGRSAAASLALMIGYGLLLHTRLLGFAPATVVYLTAAIPVLSGRWQHLPVAAAVALAMGFGCDWLFTQVFYIDLPQWHR
ncbi:MAG: tripartite tricarboxylate transporter TctB family protein [Dehalococcoidia bacterium]